MLFLQGLTLLPWAVAALIVGAICSDRRQAIAAGAVYGFVLGFSFAAFGYGGAEQIGSRVPFFALLGLVSAVFGVALSLASHVVISRIRRP